MRSSNICDLDWPSPQNQRRRRRFTTISIGFSRSVSSSAGSHLMGPE